MGVSNKTPEFMKMNPIGKVGFFSIDNVLYKPFFSYVFPEKRSLVVQVPVLETPDGPVFESNAIARYGKAIF